MNLTKILFFDLGTGVIAERHYGPDVMSLVLGGEGLANHILKEEFPLYLKSFDPADPILMMTGPMTNLTGLGGACFTMTARSPQTGRFVTSLCEGSFGPALKNSGADGLVITGRAKTLSFLEIREGRPVLTNASEYAGRGTEDLVRDLPLGKTAGMICIGKAGENGSALAGFRSGDRIYGRGGLGAIFGSRNIKAIIAHGDKPLKVQQIPLAWPAFVEAVRKTEVFVNPGLLRLITQINQNGFLQIDYGRSDRSDRVFLVSGETIGGRFQTRKKSGSQSFFYDYIASLSDGRVLPVPDLISLLALGPCIGMYESETVLELYSKVLDLGLDPVAVGGLISFDEENPNVNAVATESFPLREGKLKQWIESYAVNGFKKQMDFGSEDPSLQNIKTTAQKAAGEKESWTFRGSDLGPFYLPNLPHLATYWAVSQGIGSDDLLSAIFDKGGTEASVEIWRALDIFSKSLCVDVCALYHASNGGKNLRSVVAGLTDAKPDIIRQYLGDLLQYVATDRGNQGLSISFPQKVFDKKTEFSQEDFARRVKYFYAKNGWNIEGIPGKDELAKIGLVTGYEYLPHRSTKNRIQTVPGRILYLNAAFLFLGRTITALSKTDAETKELCDKLPETASFVISAADGKAQLKMRKNREGILVFNSGRFSDSNPLVFHVKNSATAVELFSFRKNLYESFSKGDFRVSGSLHDAMSVLGILDRLIRILMPYVLSSRLLKDPKRLSTKEKAKALIKLFAGIIIG